MRRMSADPEDLTPRPAADAGSLGINLSVR